MITDAVEVYDGVHGMQWVGVNRGVGVQAKARLVAVVHALSGDELGSSDIQGSDPYSIQVAGPLLVTFIIDGTEWVDGSDFLHARTYLVRPSETTINLRIS